jgi:hypothetical protein
MWSPILSRAPCEISFAFSCSLELWFGLVCCFCPSLLRVHSFFLAIALLFSLGFGFWPWITYGRSWTLRLVWILKRTFYDQLADVFMTQFVMIVGFILWPPSGDICSSLMKIRLLLLSNPALVALLNITVFHFRAITISDSQSLVIKWVLPFIS